MKRSVFHSFLRNDQGSTAVEFAVVASIFFTMMLGVIEYGMFTMTQVAIESAVTQAGRATAIGTAGPGGDRVGAVTQLIRTRTAGLMNANTVLITANTVANGGAMVPDLCQYENNATPDSPPVCPPWSDGRVRYVENGANGVYNGNGATSLGLAGELVEIGVAYPWQVLFPIIGQLMPNNGVVLINSSIVVRNEPF
jgi:Flp pilus assembly pilin Flp